MTEHADAVPALLRDVQARLADLSARLTALERSFENPARFDELADAIGAVINDMVVRVAVIESKVGRDEVAEARIRRAAAAAVAPRVIVGLEAPR